MNYASLTKEMRFPEDWVEPADIGREFNGVMLDPIDYYSFQISMVAVCMTVAAINRESSFHLVDAPKGTQRIVGKVSARDVAPIIAEVVSGQSEVCVESPSFFVHPGFDAQVFIGSDAPLEGIRDLASSLHLVLDIGRMSGWIEAVMLDSISLIPYPRSIPGH